MKKKRNTAAIKLQDKLATVTAERDEAVRMMHGSIEQLKIEKRDLAASQARCREKDVELIKWQQPFDADMLKEVEQQASHGDSLAAQRVYITALEHGLKQLQATLAAREARVRELEDQMNAKRYFTNEAL